MADLPTVIGPAGLQPQSPASLLAQLIALVAAVRPGYTANLPGSLVEDISSTDVYAITLIDQARVELVNSLTPLGANVFLLNQLGQMLGIPQGQATNTSVFVVFTGPPGYVIAVGFTVSDGSHQYTVQDGGIIGTGGQTPQLFCLATQPGSWAAPIGVVNQIITSVPSAISLVVTNPEAAVPGVGTETETSYRARVLQANTAASQGMAAYMKTQLTKVSGVQPRLVSAVQQIGGGWAVVCGGGDPYAVANAIYESLFDLSILTSAFLRVTGITNANPGVVTTDIDTNFTTGQVINITGVVGMTAVNNTPLTITVIGPRTFSIGVNTTSYTAYVSGGIVTPCLRNQTVSINSYPDTYTIPYINPPQQTVVISVTWNTIALNFVASAAVAQLARPALAEYIDAIPVGQPINLVEMQTVFAASVETVLPPSQISVLTFSVSINGLPTAPVAGEQVIVGDSTSYFLTTVEQITVAQG